MSSAANLAISASQSSAAAANAAMSAKCATVLPNYRPEGASVAAMREYAACVYHVHGSGEPLDPFMALALKVVIVLSLVVGVVVSFRTFRESEMMERILYPIFGVFFVWFGALALWLAAAGIAYVLGIDASYLNLAEFG